MGERFKDLNKKYDELERLLSEGRRLTVEEDSDDEDEAEGQEVLTTYCVTCGANVQTETAIRHMYRCFNKVESRTSFASKFKQQVDDRPLFCDFENKKEGTYCKRLKVLCPEHHQYQEPKVGDDEVCGFPYQRELFSTEAPASYCRRRKKDCNQVGEVR